MSLTATDNLHDNIYDNAAYGGNTYNYNLNNNGYDYGQNGAGFEEIDQNKNMEYSVPETTDMLVHMIANREKLKNDLWKFSKSDACRENDIYEKQHPPQTQHIDENELDDNIHNYIQTQPSVAAADQFHANDQSYFIPNNVQQNGGDTFDLSDNRQTNGPPQTTTNIPVTNIFEAPKQMSSEELALSKLDMLRKLAELQQSGVKLSQQYNMQSDLNTMRYEYELHRDIRSKQNGITWMSNMMMNCIWGIEMLNESYNPFDIKLNGWSQQVNADKNSYYSVFGELYEKYNQPGKNMAPELKLLMMISGSALGFHLQSSFMGKTSTLNDHMMNNPELAEQYRQKAIADKIRDQTIQNSNRLNAMMDEEHKAATQKASDLMNLKEKEMECLNMQRKQADIAQLKQKLAMSETSAQNRPINSSVGKMMDKLNNPQNNVSNGIQNHPHSSTVWNSAPNYNNYTNYNNSFIEQQKKITDKKLELLEKQREAVEQKMNIEMERAKSNNRLPQTKYNGGLHDSSSASGEKIVRNSAFSNTIDPKDLYNNMKEFDNMSISSTKSEITIYDIKDVVSKANGNAESSDHHKIIQIDTIDEDNISNDISFGTKSKRSRRSNVSKMSKSSSKKPSRGIVIDM